MIATNLNETIVSHLLNDSDGQLRPWLQQRGQGVYRVGQVRQWLFAAAGTVVQ